MTRNAGVGGSRGQGEAAGAAPHRPWPCSRARLAAALGHGLALLLVLSLLLTAGPSALAQTQDPGARAPLGLLPWQRPSGETPIATGPAPASRLQEVAPPPAVQQLQAALAERQPRVEILAPADDSLLGPGDWTLRLQVRDWPLVDAGALGLGPHLVVQLDQEEPRRITGTELTMPPLRPGSHRLTVYAARPWGEAVKSPGAWAQIRLHRSAPNPLALPGPDTAQLIPVSPSGSVAAEPVLIDWLLPDAPLQHLRSAEASWRLRISINGDAFLVDRQTPLWLRGLRSGANAVLLELLDGRGEPLNPPFNSLVSEVVLGGATPRPAWQGGRLDATTLAVLLGETPPPAVPEAATASPAPAAPPPGPLPAEPLPAETGPAETGPAEPEPTEPGPAAAIPAQPEAAASGTAAEPSPSAEAPLTAAEPSPAMEPPVAAVPADGQPQAQPEPAAPPEAGTAPETTPAPTPSPAAAVAEALSPPLPAPPLAAPSLKAPSLEAPSVAAPSVAAPPVRGVAPALPSPDRVAPSTAPLGSARDQVNDDGTLRRPERRGPLAGLREKLKG